MKNTYFICKYYILEDQVVATQCKHLRVLYQRADVIVFIDGNKSGYDLKTDWVPCREMTHNLEEALSQ